MGRLENFWRKKKYVTVTPFLFFQKIDRKRVSIGISMIYRILHDFSIHLNNSYEFVLKQLERLQIWEEIELFCQNHQKSTNVAFCENIINISLVCILKYLVCEFYCSYDCF